MPKCKFQTLKIRYAVKHKKNFVKKNCTLNKLL